MCEHCFFTFILFISNCEEKSTSYCRLITALTLVIRHSVTTQTTVLPTESAIESL